VVPACKRRRGFANRPLALRRCILEVLSRRDMLTAHDLAAAAYGWRVVVRTRYARDVTTAQLTSVRRALRALVAKGRVGVLCCYRRWRLFTLLLPDESRRPKARLAR
jgi:hypothetical protein